MKPTRTISSYVLLVGVLGLSIVGGVLAYQIYSAAVKSKTTAEQITAIKPLDGTINPLTIDNLSKRTVYTEAQMEQLLRTAYTPELVEATAAAVWESTGSATSQ